MKHRSNRPRLSLALAGLLVLGVVAAACGDDDDAGETVDSAAAVLVLESGAAATVSGLRRNGAGQDARLEVFGTLNSFGAGIDERTPIT